MKALLIPAAIDTAASEIEWDGKLESLQALVGGNVQTVPFADKVAPFFNEDGKQLGLPRNERATAMLHQSKSIFPEDFIVGDCVLTGENPRSGEPTDLADAWLKIV